MCDARAAIVIAKGVDLEDIDPAAGYDISWESYQRSHRDWVDTIVMDRKLSAYTARDCARARAIWARLRPEFLERLPWPDPVAFYAAEQRLADETRGITDDWTED